LGVISLVSSIMLARADTVGVGGTGGMASEPDVVVRDGPAGGGIMATAAAAEETRGQSGGREASLRIAVSHLTHTHTHTHTHTTMGRGGNARGERRGRAQAAAAPVVLRLIGRTQLVLGRGRVVDQLELPLVLLPLHREELALGERDGAEGLGLLLARAGVLVTQQDAVFQLEVARAPALPHTRESCRVHTGS
jgi:hypothetical protein